MHFENLITVIKERRASLQVTQDTLAQLSGVGLRTLKQFESGKGNPTLLTLHMLPEGSNKQLICNLNRIDQTDDFGLLMTAAKHDSIGAVRVVKTE